MLEGECFDIFLQTKAELVVVPPGVGPGGDIVCDGREEGTDLCEAVTVFFRDVLREG